MEESHDEPHIDIEKQDYSLHRGGSADFRWSGHLHAQGDASGQGGMAGQSGSQSGSQKNQGDQGYEKRHGQGHGKDHGKGHGKGHESDKHHMKGSQKKDVGASDTSTGSPLPGGTSDGSQTTGSGNRY